MYIDKIPLSLLLLRMNSPSCLSLASYNRCPNPFIILVALRRTRSSMSILSSTGEPRAVHSAPHECWPERKDNVPHPAGDVFQEPRMIFVPEVYWLVVNSSHPQVLFCKPAFQAVGPQPISFAGPGLGIYLFWPLWASSLPTSPAHWGTSKWQHNHLVYEPLLPILHHLQTCWGCTLSHQPAFIAYLFKKQYCWVHEKGNWGFSPRTTKMAVKGCR